MTSADLLSLLVEATVATTMAVVLVLAVRPPLRRLAGARVAYGMWALVPVALLAVLVPAPQAAGSVAGLSGLALPAVQLDVSQAASGALGMPWLLGCWIAGVLAAAALSGLAQRRFLRALGPIHRRADGLHQAHGGAGLPAAVGLLRPRIVVPPDFDHRYDADERALMVLHERLHIRSGDLAANALATVLRCLFWFNPLVHASWRRFRHDQELACDQRVLHHRPRSRRCYGEAMLKTQLADLPFPLACNWGYGHPIKERIAMLKHPLPSPRRALAGTLAVCVLSGAFVFAAWAAQPAAASQPGGADPASRALNPPKYPVEAIAQRVEGRVVLIVDIDAEGNVRDVEVESATPPGVFDEVAAEAARKWRFNPALEDGKPVSSRVRVPVDFNMDPPAGLPAGTPPAAAAAG